MMNQPVAHRPRLVALLPLLLGLLGTGLGSACGGTDDPFAGEQDAGTTGEISPDVELDVGPDPLLLGPECAGNSDCASARCEVVGGVSVCVSACSDAEDCVAGWSCEPYPEINANVCECGGVIGSDETPNEVDDNCDGVIDEGFGTIAFWNVRNLSSNSRDATEQSLIADVIEDYDFMALAEVSDDTVVDELEVLLDARGGDWASFTSDLVGADGHQERIGLLYRQEVFSVEETYIADEVTTERGEPFGREPVVAHVRAQQGEFDFAVATVHVAWSAGEPTRIAEVRALADYYRMIFERENDVLIVGDLNRNADDAEGVRWLLQEVGLITTTESTPPTKVDSLNTYDHILLNREFTTEYTGEHGVDVFDRELFPGDPAGASLALSDHRPVWIAVDLGAPDDD